MISDRDIANWNKRLADQVQYGWDNYKHLRINLATARLDRSYRIVGEFLYVEQSSSTLAVAKIKLNRNNNDELDLEKGVKIETIFIEVFITNDALEDEWLDLIFGINFKYKKKAEGGGLLGDTFVDVYRNVTQSIPSGAYTTIDFNTKVTDRNNEFDLATNLFTATKAGDYLIVAHAEMENVTGGRRFIVATNLNGPARIQRMDNYMGATGYANLLNVIPRILAVGDTIQIQVFHTTGANRNLMAGADKNSLRIYRLR